MCTLVVTGQLYANILLEILAHAQIVCTWLSFPPPPTPKAMQSPCVEFQPTWIEKILLLVSVQDITIIDVDDDIITQPYLVPVLHARCCIHCKLTNLQARMNMVLLWSTKIVVKYGANRQ